MFLMGIIDAERLVQILTARCSRLCMKLLYGGNYEIVLAQFKMMYSILCIARFTTDEE